jgi:large subunit ribosomal protein L18
MALTKRTRRLKIKQRIRKHISGTEARPRMTVFRSNKQIYVQLVNDMTGDTVVSASSKNKEVSDKSDVSKS